MIDESWKRIAALWCQDTGYKAGVWLAIDPDTDTVHLYDTAVWRRHEILVVVADSYNARGRKIPVAWRKEDQAIKDDLEDRGVNMLYEPTHMTPALAEAVVADLRLRMRSGRFTWAARLKDWKEEYDAMYRDQDSQVPLQTAPLWSATLLALHNVKNARRMVRRTGRPGTNYQKVAIV